jgi:hypothetical protein
VNDVKSIGVKLLGELELRDAMLKFRGPKGGSEGGREEIEEGLVLEEIMSVSVEKDWLFKDGELIGHPFWR